MSSIKTAANCPGAHRRIGFPAPEASGYLASAHRCAPNNAAPGWEDIRRRLGANRRHGDNKATDVPDDGHRANGR